MAPRGLVVAAPASGAGKTVVALGLMAALGARGLRVAAAKSGPDYIDPGFHAAACGRASVNLDAWAMDPATLCARAHAVAAAADLLVVEGAMGVLDGAGRAGAGSAADLAEALGLPVVLVLDAAAQAHSAALAPVGLRALRPGLELAGVVLNRVGSARHGAMLGAALDAAGVPVLGMVARQRALALPSRHLGLVQAMEHPDLLAFTVEAGRLVARGVDLDRLTAAARPLSPGGTPRRLAPLGQRIAVARDGAFAFAYPHLLDDWRVQGAEILPFSPLADEAPDGQADAVFLPGGYPELHAGTLAAARTFLAGLRAAAARGVRVYGECGGYMVLGRALIDADATTHPMAGLLPLATSFASRRLSLGYRRLAPCPGAPWSGPLRGHEFHYATVAEAGDAPALFQASDADGGALAAMGAVAGSVSGSFAHVVAPVGAPLGGPA